MNTSATKARTAADLMQDEQSASQAMNSNQRLVQLPRPETSGGMPLAEALAKRRSQREFADRPLTAREVSQLCWAAQGITDQAEGYRTCPSAGAIFPLSLFVVDSQGLYEYQPHTR